MAKFSVNPPDALLAQLDKLKNEEEIGKKMVNGAIPIVTKKIQDELLFHQSNRNLQEGSGGNLRESITEFTKAKKTKSGDIFTKSYPKGYENREYKNGDTEKVAHAIKMVALEYGTSKQRSDPFLSEASRRAEQPVIDKMQEIFNEEVKN